MTVENPRMDLLKIAPEAFALFFKLEETIAPHVDPTLLHLVKMRASQINGCALCLAMHTDHALAAGEKPERLTLLDAWAESPLYSDKERAALAWVEEVTLIADSGASREAFDGLKPHFSEEEIGWLTLAVMQINSWNRLAISSRSRYNRGAHAEAAAAARQTEPA